MLVLMFITAALTSGVRLPTRALALDNGTDVAIDSVGRGQYLALNHRCADADDRRYHHERLRASQRWRRGSAETALRRPGR